LCATFTPKKTLTVKNTVFCLVFHTYYSPEKKTTNSRLCLHLLSTNKMFTFNVNFICRIIFCEDAKQQQNLKTKHFVDLYMICQIERVLKIKERILIVHTSLEKFQNKYEILTR